MSAYKTFGKFFLSVFLPFLLTACSALLMLPDELSEAHYRESAGDISTQVKTKMIATNPGVRVGAGEGREVGILPVVYIYDTSNTLKKGEEAYYTSIFNNSSGSWIRPFAVDASNAIRDELTARGFKPFIYSNSDLQTLGMKSAMDLMPRELMGTQFRAIAYNGDSAETNYAMTDVTQFRNAIVNDIQAVAFMKIHADWEPSSANRLNGDIVLNTGLKFGYEIVICGANSGCGSVSTPFTQGIGTNVFMPNRNTIDDDGLDKNYEIIRSIHGDQLRKVVKMAFEKFASQGMFK